MSNSTSKIVFGFLLGVFLASIAENIYELPMWHSKPAIVQTPDTDALFDIIKELDRRDHQFVEEIQTLQSEIEQLQHELKAPQPKGSL